MTAEKTPDRREFLRGTLTASLSVPALAAASYGRVPGANGRVRVGFLGCGARGQAHVHMARRVDADAVMVCDVWDGHAADYDHDVNGRAVRRSYSQGLFPSAVRAGLGPHDPRQATKDYRRVLDRPDIDAVCIATPDHWHARMILDAVAAGKDVLCETPLTRTAAEAAAVGDALARSGAVVSLGVQSLAHPVWAAILQRVEAGDIDPVTHLSAQAYRSDPRGEWRYYRTWPEMTARTVDWPRFLGHGVSVDGVPIGPSPTDCPFDPATFAQWRCDARLSGGPLSDWLAPLAARLLAASGLRRPTQALALGQRLPGGDGRTVPDTATVLANFDGGAQMVLTASAAAVGPAPGTPTEVIRGRRGTVVVTKAGYELHRDGRNVELVPVPPPAHDTEALWRDFLRCVRERDRRTLATVEVGIGAALVCGA